MLEISQYLHNAALILVGLALVATIVVHATANRMPTRARALPVGAAAAGTRGDGDAEPLGTADTGPDIGIAWHAERLVELALACLTIALALRTIISGHAPFANQYEFGSAFAWGMLAAYVYFARRFRARALALLVLPLVAAMLLYTSNLEKDVAPLVPALQNSLLLTLHVVTAVIGYGAAAVSVAAAVLYLLHPRLRRHGLRWHGLPGRDTLDEIAYRAVVLTFPMLTMMNILGALWADIAWGRYWSWDPKETAAFVTWLIYGAYLHARVVADWRGSRSAWLLIVAFAAILFTFLGNHFLGGMHSYA